MKDAKMLAAKNGDTTMMYWKDTKILLIIKNCSIELAQKIAKLVSEHNASERKKSDNEAAA